MASNYGYTKNRSWTISPASRKYIIHTDSLQPVHPPSPVRMVQGLYCKVRSVYPWGSLFLMCGADPGMERVGSLIFRWQNRLAKKILDPPLMYAKMFP